MSTKMKLEICWSHGDSDIVVTVVGQYYPGRPAKVSGPPEDCYPADPDEFGIESLSVDDGQGHEDLWDDDRFYEALMEAAREEFSDMVSDRQDDEQADRAYWAAYDTGRA